MNTDFVTPPTLEAANVFTRQAEQNLRDWLAQVPGPSQDVCKAKEKELFRKLVGIADFFSIHH